MKSEIKNRKFHQWHWTRDQGRKRPNIILTKLNQKSKIKRDPRKILNQTEIKIEIFQKNINKIGNQDLREWPREY